MNDLQDDFNFAEFVKAYRSKNDLTQEQLAKMLLVSLEKVVQWENEDAVPAESMKKRIFSILNIESDDDYTYY